MQEDLIYMQRALELAKKGIGGVNPNPLVGAVIVKNGKIIGEGYHALFGGDHAEIEAFNSATESVQGATMYVTLEPCSYFGKTPPCANAIVDKKIARVVIGMLDLNPLVSGNGIKILEDNKIEVSCGLLEEELTELNRVFLKFIKTKQPYIVMKTAMTLDGKIATHTGDSKWVSGNASRKYVHEMRNELTAIMVGVNTVIADDCLLTTRLHDKKTRNPLRIVIDSTARIPLNAKILNTSEQASTLIVTTEKASTSKLEQIRTMGNETLVVPSQNGRVDLEKLMLLLGKKGIDGILLEGGAALNFAALKAEIIDEVVSFIAPKIVGGASAKTPVGGEGISEMNKAIGLENIKITKINDDLMLSGKIKKEKK